MKRKYKLTGFARLFIFLLFFLPVLYVGVSMYHGEKPLEKIEALFQGKEKKTKPTISKEIFGVKDEGDYKQELKGKNNEIELLKKKVEKLERELKKFKDHSH